MSIPEEAAKVAASTVEALKSTPIVLALVIFNCMFMGLSFYTSVKISERWDKEISRWEALVRSCQGMTVREKQDSP